MDTCYGADLNSILNYEGSMLQILKDSRSL